MNKAFCRSTHYDFYELIGEGMGFAAGRGRGEPLFAQIRRTMAEKESVAGEVRFRRRSGETYPAWLMVSAVREQRRRGGQPSALPSTSPTASSTRERIQFLAHHDVLTELPNRSLCVQRLQMALAQAPSRVRRWRCCSSTWTASRPSTTRWATTLATACCARWPRATQAVRSRDAVSRLGGDEFVVVMRDVAGREDVQQLVERRLIRSSAKATRWRGMS